MNINIIFTAVPALWPKAGWRTKTVSYTHLDVYKRQLWESLEPPLREACEKFVQTRILEGRNLEKDLIGKLDSLGINEAKYPIAYQVIIFHIMPKIHAEASCHKPDQLCIFYYELFP